jgi:hypothetical protein
MAKKLSKDVRELIEGQIECEGFDYAFTEKLSAEEIGDEEVVKAMNAYLSARGNFIDVLKTKGVNVDEY